MSSSPSRAAQKVLSQNLNGFPYHPIVFHLDLCILSYQLYAQSLTWPFDPYYEDLNNLIWDRKNSMVDIENWAKKKGKEQVTNQTGLDSYRGPGVLGGFENNPNHDPIIYRYDLLHPWSHALCMPQERWVKYMTPDAITKQIKDVFVAYRKTNAPADKVVLDQIIPQQIDSNPNAQDVILVFEGGTGDRGEPGQPASQSLMGFVMMRYKENSDSFDLHVVFRGSRSGSVARAFFDALSDKNASGSPDWITDMCFDRIGPSEGGSPISTIGKVNRGFVKSMESVYPQLFRCFEKVATLSPNRNPDNIFVSGHSLGGALAQHFVSSVLIGSEYGPNGTGKAMPDSMQNWPWKHIKLCTFGGPRAGDKTWAKHLTETNLSSEFFSSYVDPIDRDALSLTDESVLSRMTNPNKPVGFRVLISNDPITTGIISGGKHVGTTLYLDDIGFIPNPPNPYSHEPTEMRKLMISSLSDPRIPATAWQYLKLEELTPNRDDSNRGSVEEYKKLADSIQEYYRSSNQWFDDTTFKKDFEEFCKIIE
ncbi:MAG: hypothetical protein P1U56_05875 [Saprospiraceae bacterium]|nr:hypothetical protein [Saprospiraceae bacterium]